MNKLVVSFIVVSTCFFASVSAKDVLVSSPDGTVTVAVGVKVYCEGETKTPWRTIIIGKTAGELMTNRVMLNLNEPSRLDDTSWIEPCRSVSWMPESSTAPSSTKTAPVPTTKATPTL